ncbi:MAG: hypothetical protein LLG09_03365 [Negativicutes bacterium]|nr:hypothetical protein [Negativicutes bacterium]
MKLNNLENYIDQKILARGLAYFKENRVLSIEAIGDNEYEAKVEGTELYTVAVTLDEEDHIIDSVCTCPYDMGEYCKHQVAVFFGLREMKGDSGRQSGDSGTQPPAVITKPLIEKQDQPPAIREILAGRQKEELIDFLLKIASAHEEIRRQIEFDFFNGSEIEEIKQSIRLIRTYIDQYADCHGDVSYENVYQASEGAGLVLEKARANLQKRKNLQAVQLALCVIHEMLSLIQSADDSDGVISGEIEESLAFIEEVIEIGELNQSDQQSIFELLAEETISSRYRDWTGWQLSYLECCSKLADTQVLRDECDRLFTLTIADKDENSWSGSYFIERVKLIRYNTIKRNEGPDQAREFIEENLKYTSFRVMAIENAMQEQDYAKAEKLALAGEDLDQNSSGLVKRWKEYRYAMYKETGNLEKQRAIAREFIFDGNYEYYRELKRTYCANEWLSVYPQIILQLEEQKKTHYAVYSQILIEEAEKQKLLQYLQESPSEIESFYQYLLPEFQDAVYTIFLRHIEQTAAKSSDRKAYQHVCSIIGSLKRAGGDKQALANKQELLLRYQKKPAFRDELSKI